MNRKEKKGETMTKRKYYNNGHPVTLNGCDGCNVIKVNGILVHEQGCPDQWRDQKIDCFECGFEFRPEEKFQTICAGCLEKDIDM